MKYPGIIATQFYKSLDNGKLSPLFTARLSILALLDLPMVPFEANIRLPNTQLANLNGAV